MFFVGFSLLMYLPSTCQSLELNKSFTSKDKNTKLCIEFFNWKSVQIPHTHKKRQKKKNTNSKFNLFYLKWLFAALRLKTIFYFPRFFCFLLFCFVFCLFFCFFLLNIIIIHVFLFLWDVELQVLKLLILITWYTVTPSQSPKFAPPFTLFVYLFYSLFPCLKEITPSKKKN